MRYRYDKQGLLALEPRAFMGFFQKPERPDNAKLGAVEVVTIHGPLEHHPGWSCDSYDEILDRVDAACLGTASTVVLNITSPGGEVSGMIDAARVLRARCALAGKKLVAFVDGQACSAAYALACAAERIVVSPEALVGSIGIIATRVDVTEANKLFGTQFAVVTSGARKSDGNPNTAITEAELAETQRVVDELAGVFFGLVSEMRGMPTAAVAALDARLLVGQAAVDAGLADAVLTFDQLLAELASPEGTMTTKGKFDEARAALEEAAKGEGDEAAKAKRALAALDQADEDEGEQASDESTDEEKEPEQAEDEADEPAAAAAGTGVSGSTAGQIAGHANDVGKRLAAIEKRMQAEQVNTLLASRPDLDAGLVALLRTKPFAEVQQIVKSIKKPAKVNPAAAAAAAGTRGAGQGGLDAGLTPDDAMDAAMGITPVVMGARKEGDSMVFGAMHKRTAEGGAK